MSPMRSLRNHRPRTSALLLVLMFLFADLALPHTMDGWSELEDETTVSRVVSTHAIHADTYITAGDPTTTHNTSATGILAEGLLTESRLLLRFPMNATSSDTVHEASVDLQCTTTASGSTRMVAYVGSMSRMWNGSYATWGVYENNMVWDTLGADGAADRGTWEPPTTITSNGTLSLNVTSLAQSAARANSAYLSVIVASVGATYSCAMSEATATSSRPQLVLDTSTGAATSGATVVPDLPVDDGMPWMESDFLLTPVTTPTLSYASNTGQDVEMQLSNDADWLSSTDAEWHFSTLWSSFTTSGTAGSYALPSSLALVNGTTMYMRVRAVDANDQWGDWEETSFLLPALDVVDNGDGTATLTLAPAATGLAEDFFQDATVSEISKTI